MNRLLFAAAFAFAAWMLGDAYYPLPADPSVVDENRFNDLFLLAMVAALLGAGFGHWIERK